MLTILGILTGAIAAYIIGWRRGWKAQMDSIFDIPPEARFKKNGEWWAWHPTPGGGEYGEGGHCPRRCIGSFYRPAPANKKGE